MKKLDSSFDREQALALAQRLAETRTTIEIQVPERADAFRDQMPLAPPSADFGDKEIYRDQVWHVLLQWAKELIVCTRVFACDSDGLVIADVGEADGAAEELPSLVVTLIGNLQRHFVSQPKLVSIQLEHNWVTAIPLTVAQGLVLGLISLEAPKPQALQHLSAIFHKKLATL